MLIENTTCTVPLQDLLEHTVKRLFLSLNLEFGEDLNAELILYLKYGFDGTNAKRYKQNSGEKSSALDYIFCSSLVPLKLVHKGTEKVYWVNPKPSSTRFCRPINILYEKETNELCKKVNEDLKMQIDNLKNVEIGGCEVGFDMKLTMIDGKVSIY